jgi:peptidoglycan/xylan/chitin deacetylase (PgdA/CDA1 family)
MRVLVALLILLIAASPACAERFAAISLHDVADDEGKLGADDISTAQLTALFDWLKGNGWSTLTFDDIEAARAGKRPLPAKAILLTFDDGYVSIYSRVYPLLEAYHFHAVFFLVGAWMDAPPNGTVHYGDEVVPRSRFVSWEHAREMQASGLAEFGSHSYDLHRVIVGNPQGSRMGAAATWAYDAATKRYETDAELEARVRADLEHSVALMRANLGRAPRALAWPFGRYSGPALLGARQAGFRYVLNLTPEPADTRNASQPTEIPRLYPSQNPNLATIIGLLRFTRPDPEQRRIVCLGLDRIARGTPEEASVALGRTIEDLRRLGANTVVLDPVAARGPDGAIQSVWFRSTLLPVKNDFLSFAAWQIDRRAGANVYLRIDLNAAVASVGTARVPDLVREIIRVAPIEGVVLDPPGLFVEGGAAPTAWYPWAVRAERNALHAANPHEQLALDAWRAAETERPGSQLGIVAPPQLPGAWPAPAADLILVSPSGESAVAIAEGFAQKGWLKPDASSRLALPLPVNEPDAAMQSMHEAQTLGAAAFAFCPATDLPNPKVSATFSAARFPWLP